jgi:hypothetical protein
MRIDLRELEPNPFRDFSVDPIDKALVKRLQTSIEEDGFWGGIVCRKLKDGTLQIGAGHHRVEAALRAGILEADVFVSKDMDDDTMVRVYARENATQRGNSAQALHGSVIGAVRRISQELLGSEDAQIGASSDPTGNQRLAKGIGYRQILAKLGEGHDEHEVSSALGLLKQSGDYDRVIAKVAKDLGVKMPKPATDAPKVDVRIAQEFEVQSQLDTFRKSVAKLAEDGTLPVKNQVELAKQLKAKAAESGREMSSAFIREELNAAVMGVKQHERKLNREEQARLTNANFTAKWKQRETNFNQAVRMLASAAQGLTELEAEWPKNLAVPISRELREAVRLAKKTIDKLSERL